METIKDRQEKAAALLDKGDLAQRQGDLGDAMRLYQESIQIYPTAEAHTSLGWTYHFLHRYGDAIEECRTAIALNPEFGNPYNDIGLSHEDGQAGRRRSLVTARDRDPSL